MRKPGLIVVTLFLAACGGAQVKKDLPKRGNVLLKIHGVTGGDPRLRKRALLFSDLALYKENFPSSPVCARFSYQVTPGGEMRDISLEQSYPENIVGKVVSPAIFVEQMKSWQWQQVDPDYGNHEAQTVFVFNYNPRASDEKVQNLLKHCGVDYRFHKN